MNNVLGIDTEVVILNGLLFEVRPVRFNVNVRDCGKLLIVMIRLALCFLLQLWQKRWFEWTRNCTSGSIACRNKLSKLLSVIFN